MTPQDRDAFAARMQRAVAAAAARGEHAYGYQVRDGAIILWTRPAERRRRQPEAAPADQPRRIRRGVQGQLL